MGTVTIRPPTAAEFATAQRILRAARLDPTTPLRIERTLVAVTDDGGGSVVGVGQLKQHRGCQELGSLVVVPEYRQQGIAAQLIAALEAQAERPLYLTCLAHMEPYYERFGYRSIPYRQYPAYFKLKMLLALLAPLFGIHPRVMRKE